MRELSIASQIRALHRRVLSSRSGEAICAQCFEVVARRDLYANRKLTTTCLRCKEVDRVKKVCAARQLIIAAMVLSPTKICTHCGVDKPRCEYRKAPGTKVPGCVVPACKACEKVAREKAYWALSAEERKALNKKTAAAHGIRRAPERALRDTKREAKNLELSLRTEKSCSKCGCVRPMGMFTPHKRMLGGRSSDCKPCQAEVASARRAKDPQGYLEQVRLRAGVNPEKQKRRTALRKATTRPMPWTDKAAIRRVFQEAQRLTEQTGVKHAVDHIYPLVSELVSGLHVQDNLRAVPSRLNAKKLNKLPGCRAEELWVTGRDLVFYEENFNA